MIFSKRTEITLEEAEKLQTDTYVFADMRGEIAYAHGHIPGAVRWDAGKGTDGLPTDKALIIYCSIGENSVPAARELRSKGYEAYSLKGGFRSWLLRSCDELTLTEMQRYDRQMLLPQVGMEGQKKLKNAKVLIVGAGALGAPAALYLAGAGVGTIGVMDADSVSVSNLHRQIIHSMDRIGVNKAKSAKTAMERQNDLIRVEAHPYFLTPENAEETVGRYDFVIDASDNFETKFLLNDACVLAGKPFCHAGVLQFQGQVMTYVPGDYPCYRCIFEEIPEEGTVPDCSQAGVLGAVPGIIGSIQALEAVKYIIGAGELLTGRMLIFDGLTMSMRTVRFQKKNESCRVCGSKRQINNVKDHAGEYERNACQGTAGFGGNLSLC